MQRSSIFALSPLDGRYVKKTASLAGIFSEYGFIRARVTVEIKWLKTLAASQLIPDMPNLDDEAVNILDDIIDMFSEEDANCVKQLEEQTNHDVKAIEYFLKKRTAGNARLEQAAEFIHFGCTSEDINNLAYGMMLLEALIDHIFPALTRLEDHLRQLSRDYASLPMLARTHGQPATPTTVGKEFANFYVRLHEQTEKLRSIRINGKLNGATGCYNALTIACPEVDWEQVSSDFVNKLWLSWNHYTTQIEPHDYMADIFDTMRHINTILIGLNRDMWSYISIEYFRLKPRENEVGSSTMPHKVNPIDFENSEGNLGLANALFSHMSDKLPISRWQRDLSDSTVLRNIGVAFGYSLVAYQSILAGLGKVSPNPEKIALDLDRHWEVLAEAVQTVMRRYHIPEPYEKLKLFTRGKDIDRETIRQFITGLELPAHVKERLLKLTPEAYTGYAASMAKRV